MQRKTGRAVATGAGAVAGGISGTLGTALTQTFGWTEGACTRVARTLADLEASPTVTRPHIAER